MKYPIHKCIFNSETNQNMHLFDRFAEMWFMIPENIGSPGNAIPVSVRATGRPSAAVGKRNPRGKYRHIQLIFSFGANSSMVF